MNESMLKKGIIRCGQRLYDRFLVAARSGNISARVGMDSVLITASGTGLGSLNGTDIVKVDIASGRIVKGGKPSSELPLHRMIYEKMDCTNIIHCHPPLTNAYFAVYPRLKELIFETRYTLGEVPVIGQRTVTVEDPGPVVGALKKNPIVVLKNHGVVAVGQDFTEPFYLIEALESAVEVAAVARLFDKKVLDKLDTCMKKRLKKA